MLACLPRLVLSLICYPLLGAYGLRWAGRYVMEVGAALGLTKGDVLPFLDIIGAGVGVLVGVYLALALIPACCQRRNEPLRATADILLLILATVFLVDAILPALVGGTGLAAGLPPLTLVVWLATGAATLRLAGLRRRGARRVMPRGEEGRADHD